MLRRLILLLFWAVAGAAAAGVPTADALWGQGDYRGAFAQAFEAAGQGDAHAQFLLGEAYRLGRSVDPDILSAQDWYKRAADQGDVAAATELGLLYADAHDPGRALPWLTFAAMHGEPRALCTLAALYFNDEGVAPDPVLAYALMSRAAASGLPEAQQRLGLLRGVLAPDVQVAGATLAAERWGGASPQLSRAPPSVAPIAPAVVRIRMGQFRSVAAAERNWAFLADRIAGIGGTDHAVVRVGALYRLQARLPDADAARDFSHRTRAAHVRHSARRGSVIATGQGQAHHRLRRDARPSAPPFGIRDVGRRYVAYPEILAAVRMDMAPSRIGMPRAFVSGQGAWQPPAGAARTGLVLDRRRYFPALPDRPPRSERGDVIEFEPCRIGRAIRSGQRGRGPRRTARPVWPPVARRPKPERRAVAQAGKANGARREIPRSRRLDSPMPSGGGFAARDPRVRHGRQRSDFAQMKSANGTSPTMKF